MYGLQLIDFDTFNYIFRLNEAIQYFILEYYFIRKCLVFEIFDVEFLIVFTWNLPVFCHRQIIGNSKSNISYLSVSEENVIRS